MNSNHPKKLGKYILLDQMAVGGMAELYRAMITGVQGFEKLIAIKKILPHLAGEEELIAAFIDEAKLAALLHHQNIVQIYDFGSLDGSYFIAMEYLLGKDLRLISKKSIDKQLPLELGDALYIISRICSGLNYAHTLRDFQGKPLQIIHRDISPPNVLVTYEGNVKIVDFGIAKAANQTTMTKMGMVKGKVAYMSPEQAEGKVIDHRSDIFSCGILLYELVTGRRMFEGETLHILSHVRDCLFEPAEKVAQNLPENLIKILHKALSKDPDLRYLSCGEMESDLEECMYENSLHPTAHGLARYLKKLFEDEITAEEAIIKQLTGFGSLSNGTEAAVKIKNIEPVSKKTTNYSDVTTENVGQFLSRLKNKSNKRNKPIIYAASGLSAIIVILVFIFILNKDYDDDNTSDTVAKQLPAIHEESNNTTVPAYSAGNNENNPEPKQEEPPSEVEIAIDVYTKDGYEAALPLFEKLLTSQPGLLADISVPFSKALTEKADSLIKTNPKEAESLLTRATEIDPENAQAFENLGRLYMMEPDYPLALMSYNKAAELTPDNPRLYFAMGYIYGINKEYQKASDMYSRVIDLNPDYLDDALFNLSAMQIKLGNIEQGIENLKKALSVNPDNSQAKELLEKLSDN